MTAAPSPARAVAPLLVFGIGNPSRGDDALGPTFVEALETALALELARGAVELITDFQLQPEHALDLMGRACAFFVDATALARGERPGVQRPLSVEPFVLSAAVARRDASFSTHAMSPDAVLQAYRGLGSEPPTTYVLGIGGVHFELGEAMSAQACAHLDAALAWFLPRVRAFVGGEAGAFEAREGRRLEVTGTVQGVGFRPFVRRLAKRFSLAGRVLNTGAGVTVDVYGSRVALDAFVRALQVEAPEAARLRSLSSEWLEAAPGDDFVIERSDEAGAKAMTVPADLGLCDDCAREVDDPRTRHHGYAFTACTACGPRYSVLESLPYDRARTAMRAFPLCEACVREYADVDDRRFHAEAIACGACGPRLWLAQPTGEVIPSPDPIAEAAEWLLQGKILGVQGLGGFHLACDATQSAAVSTLRARKRRDDKPFAVMVADVAGAQALGSFEAAALAALSTPARPIVLVPARVPSGAAPLAAEVSGPSRRVGLVLPYTALQRLLLERVGRPLVMTSGNSSGEPIALTHEDARRQLSPLVDALLLHDREMVRRVEDSVVAPIAGAVRVVRRARGFAPNALALAVASPEPVLAVGGHMKSAACLVVGDRAYLTPHLGDLDGWCAEQVFRAEIEGFEALLGVRAELLAHDAHPDYATTRYALARVARERFAVQHHVAHVLSAVAERGVVEPVVGVALDGSGWGTDGTSWGGEVLEVDARGGWRRAATLRPLPLPGGERAIRDVWRVAWGALLDAFGDEAHDLAARFPVFERVSAQERRVVARMVETSFNTVRARGLGRYFDAVGALLLGLPRAAFEGHVTIALEEAVRGEAPPYHVDLPPADAEGLVEVDLRPMLRAVVRERLEGREVGVLAARFHATVVDVMSRLALAAAHDGAPILLCGGALQNDRLACGLSLACGGERVWMPSEVPVNDGGLALGQAYGAVLALSSRCGHGRSSVSTCV